MQRYRSFGAFMKSEYGFRVYKVNVDAGFTCPNRDGTLGLSGCIYCNNDSFRPNSCKPTLPLSEQIENGIAHIRKRYKANKFIVYFQPYTNTYAPLETLISLYTEALKEPDVIGLAIGTRPDAVDSAKIGFLEELARRHFILIEYGLQSVHDKSLTFINRGHDFAAFVNALEMTKDRGIHIGAHVIAGFPTETCEETLAMADAISSLPVGFLKVHQLQVVSDTLLADMYHNKPFPTFGYGEYLDFIVDFIERVSPDLIFQRLFATAPDNILIAPDWGRSRYQILNDIEKRLEERDAQQGSKYRLQPIPAKG
jgi:uncharacterized protein